MSQTEELDFRTTMEALFVDALGGQMTPGLKERLREEGLDLDRLAPAYPRRVFSRCCRITAEALYPHDPVDQALRTLGRLMIEGYSRSVIGRAVAGVFIVVGVRRAMERVTRAFRHGDNYTVTKFTPVSEGVADLWFNQVNGQPTFTQGALEAALAWVGGKDGRVDIVRTDGDECLYRLRWGEAAGATGAGT